MKRDVKIDVLRFVALCAVLILHTLFIFDKKENHTSNVFVTSYFVGLRFCVPLFIIISGNLILNKTYSGLRNFYLKRCWRIVPGFLIFAPPYLFLRYYFENESITSIIRNGLIFGQPSVHLWYVYMIFVLYFMAPFLHRMVHNISNKELIFFNASLFILTWISEVYFYYSGKDTIWLFKSYQYLGYFILGYTISRIRFVERINYHRAIYVLLYLFSTLILFKADYPFIRSYTSFPVVIQTLSVFLLVYSFNFRENGLIQKITGVSYGIYLFHYLVFYFINLLLVKYKMAQQLNPLYWCLIFSVIGLSISYLIVSAINKLVKTG